MTSRQTAFADKENIWRIRVTILIVSLVFIGLELALFAFQVDQLQYFARAETAPIIFPFFAIRFCVLFAMCVLFYALLEWADRYHLLLAVLALGIAFLPLALLHTYLIRIAAEWMELETGPPGTLILAADYWIQFMLVWSAGVLATFNHSRLRYQQRLRLEASASAHRLKMRAVRYRLNPHFLFNTLNSIGLLALERRSQDATGLISRLSDFLRATLRTDPRGFHSLSREFKQVADYLEIERIRFPDRLSSSFILPEELRFVAVPPFVLQPLAERFIRYGVSASARSTAITIQARREGNVLSLELSHSGDEIDVAKLQLTRDDLPNGYSLRCQATASGVLAILRGPFLKMDQRDEHDG
jgi:hypothetical protein